MLTTEYIGYNNDIVQSVKYGEDIHYLHVPNFQLSAR